MTWMGWNSHCICDTISCIIFIVFHWIFMFFPFDVLEDWKETFDYQIDLWWQNHKFLCYQHNQSVIIIFHLFTAYWYYGSYFFYSKGRNPLTCWILVTQNSHSLWMGFMMYYNFRWNLLKDSFTGIMNYSVTGSWDALGIPVSWVCVENTMLHIQWMVL